MTKEERVLGDCVLHEDVLRRLGWLEVKVEDLERCTSVQAVVDAEIARDIKALSSEVKILRTETLATIKEHTEQIWNLINRGVKIIIGLVVIITVLAGVRVGPDIIKMLM